jgi:hypothetical protein
MADAIIYEIHKFQPINPSTHQPINPNSKLVVDSQDVSTIDRSSAVMLFPEAHDMLAKYVRQFSLPVMTAAEQTNEAELCALLFALDGFDDGVGFLKHARPVVASARLRGCQDSVWHTYC